MEGIQLRRRTMPSLDGGLCKCGLEGLKDFEVAVLSSLGVA